MKAHNVLDETQFKDYYVFSVSYVKKVEALGLPLTRPGIASIGIFGRVYVLMEFQDGLYMK